MDRNNLPCSIMGILSGVEELVLSGLASKRKDITVLI